MVCTYNPSPEEVEKGVFLGYTGRLASQPSLIGECRVLVRDPVSQNKVDAAVEMD